MKKAKIMLKFPEHETSKPIAWLFATEYGLRFSILQADIRAGRGGRIIMDISGEEDDITRAVAFARQENVEVQFLSRVVRWENDVCVHCGACTAVCTSKALTLDKETCELNFDNSKCLACEMCTQACPTGAMHVEFM